MQITSTMLRRIAAMPEQAMAVAVMFLAEQLEAYEAEQASLAEQRAMARDRQEKSRQKKRDASVTNPSQSRESHADVTETPSRALSLPSLSESVERVREEPPINPPATSEPPFFDAFWDAYPKRAGSRDRKGAVKAFRAATRRVDPAVIIEGALQYANFCRLSDKEGTEFIKQARSWLNADGWTETYDIPRSSTNGTIQSSWAKASAVLREQDRREGICREGGEDDLRALPEPEGGTGIFGRID